MGKQKRIVWLLIQFLLFAVPQGYAMDSTSLATTDPEAKSANAANSESEKRPSNETVLQGFVEYVKPALKPGLVPYSDELTITGLAIFDEHQTNKTLKEKCSLVDIMTHGKNLGLYKGRVLFNCRNDLHVVTPDATIDIAKGSIVYVYSTGESVVVLNLHDEHRRSVLARIDGAEFEIPPGREILVTRYPDLSFDDARLCPGIWYRSVHEIVNKPTLKAYLTQFSTISAFSILPAVRKMVAQQDKCSKKITKTFAAVLMVSRDRQSFRPKTAGSSPGAKKSTSGMVTEGSKQCSHRTHWKG